jgi:hypothetical protein
MLTWDDITGKVQRHIIPRLIDVVYKSSPVFTRIRTRCAERFEGGTKISQPIGYAELNGDAYKRGGQFRTEYVQTDTNIEVTPKFYYVTISAYGPDNVLARGPEASMSYIESKFVNASGKMAKLLTQNMYRDGQNVVSDVIHVDGFLAALDNGSVYASYGGVTRSDLGVVNGTNNQGINAYVNSMATFNMKGMQTAFGASYFGNEHVDMIATTQDCWNLIYNKILPQQRFQETDNDIAKIGFQALRWNGVTIVVDQYCPAGYIWGLNTNYLQFWVSTLPRYQFGWTGFKEAQGTDDMVGQYLWSGNFLVTSPRMFFQLNGVVG